MLFVAVSHGSEGIHPTHYLLIRLLQDQASLHDPMLTELLIPAFEELRESLRQDPWEDEHPFCLLAIILLRLQKGDSPASLRDLARALIADESAIRTHHEVDKDQFLLGLTNFNGFHDDWRLKVAEIIPASVPVEELTLIRQAIVVD